MALAAAVGFAASLLVHALSFVEPGGGLGDGVFVLHLGVFVVFAPIVLALVELGRRRGVEASDKRAQQRLLLDLLRALPAWQKAVLGATFAHAMVNFALAFVGSMDGPSEVATDRLFSGHWMFFYLLSALLAERLPVLGRL